MASRHPITCHILDTTTGKPAANVNCTLFRIGEFDKDLSVSEPETLGTALTNSDGRIARWTLAGTSSDEGDLALVPGVYKIKFQTLEYFKREGSPVTGSDRTFFPFVEIMFIVENPPDKHYHIPLLLSNYSYSTYRGS
ncbi:conserved hypothetical protein [Geotrichum candidum]|mgnify:CR=1 FL=1|uniref:5-hydroxyisourate hydrolase n=1 Tax=Geotrichum candidum TaxID=1173061 RepID=A0A0J9XEJ3_GEOCN|nr:conserved hypothetical protein [Geotrichum candidum]